jgi:hypothetical protein
MPFGLEFAAIIGIPTFCIFSPETFEEDGTMVFEGKGRHCLELHRQSYYGTVHSGYVYREIIRISRWSKRKVCGATEVLAASA